MWIIKYAEKFFKIKIDDILLVGDSVGGNLFLSLTYILILKCIRLPNVIFLFYPALKMCVYIFSLSYLNCIIDPILYCNLLKFYIKAYLDPNNSDDKNSFFFPLFMSDNILKELPPIRIFG